ncbi:hypothetical protein L345_00211, partial [Ophiophagus hannah]
MLGGNPLGGKKDGEIHYFDNYFSADPLTASRQAVSSEAIYRAMDGHVISNDRRASKASCKDGGEEEKEEVVVVMKGCRGRTAGYSFLVGEGRGVIAASHPARTSARKAAAAAAGTRHFSPIFFQVKKESGMAEACRRKAWGWCCPLRVLACLLLLLLLPPTLLPPRPAGGLNAGGSAAARQRKDLKLQSGTRRE